MIRDLITKLKRDENERQKTAAASAGKPLHWWFSCGPTTKTPSTAAAADTSCRRSVTSWPSQDFTTHISNNDDAAEAVGKRRKRSRKGVRTTVTTWKPSWSAYCGEPPSEAGVAEPLFWKIIRRALSHISQSLSLSLSLCLVVVSFLNSWLSSARRQIGFSAHPQLGAVIPKEQHKRGTLPKVRPLSIPIFNLRSKKRSSTREIVVVEWSKRRSRRKRKVFNSSCGMKKKKGVLSEWTRVGGGEGRNKVTRQERLFCKAAWSRSSHTHTHTHTQTHVHTHRKHTISLSHTHTY